MRATLDWSYQLLSNKEQLVFARLAVFASHFSLDAAEAVCAEDKVAPNDVLDLLGRLVDKSLLLAEERDGVTRYRLLELSGNMRCPPPRVRRPEPRRPSDPRSMKTGSALSNCLQATAAAIAKQVFSTPPGPTRVSNRVPLLNAVLMKLSSGFTAEDNARRAR
jgi:hypothetical protein